jgi:RHS repeat-associated protein
VLATFGYDQLGRRSSLTRGNGTVTGYTPDAVSRLQQLSQDLPGTSNDLTLGFAYNPAGQIASTTRSNDLYAWTGHGSGTTSTTSNGRNQIAGWVNTLGYDSKGNVTGDGTYAYGYSSENLLTSLSNSATGAIQSSSSYAYDPLMRLAKIDSNNSALDADLGYDGQEIVLEGLSSSRTRRYVFGPGTDEPLVAYLVTSTGTTRSWLQADERGSTLRQTDDSGNPSSAVGRYDEYGAGLGVSRFQYTGQYWLGDANLHYYRARVYDPKLGRFLQPDPIGYGGGMNLYAYVRGDPVNLTDPLGLEDVQTEDIFVTGKRKPDTVSLTGAASLSSVGFSFGPQAYYDPLGDGGGGGGGPVKDDKCEPDPGPVNFDGTILHTPAGPSVVMGDFRNPQTGQEGSVVGLGVGGGATGGALYINATFTNVYAIDNGFEFSFAYAFGHGGSVTIRNFDNQIVGYGSVGAKLAPPVGAGGITVEDATLRVKEKGC